MFIVSSSLAGPLANGQYTMSTERPWQEAHKAGLREADYGRTWFVYESERDYRDLIAGN